MRFDNTEVLNIEGALRGMRFPMKGSGDTYGDFIGEKDMNLAMRLWRASEEDNLAHSKFLRQIFISVDITAPLYFWSEMDTYKISTTANSESTIHKLLKDVNYLCLHDFEYDEELKDYLQNNLIPELKIISNNEEISEVKKLRLLKQALPTSYLQKRHWTANYEVVRNIVKQRKNHKLTEWSKDFINWAKSLPYSKEFIFGGKGY